MGEESDDNGSNNMQQKIKMAEQCLLNSHFAIEDNNKRTYSNPFPSIAPHCVKKGQRVMLNAM